MSMYVTFGGMITSHLVVAVVCGLGCFAYGYILGKKKG